MSVSPRLGSGFSGNADFFGLAYNGDFRTQVLGFGNHPDSPLKPFAPGPTIVAAVKNNGQAPVAERLLIEDLSFPRAYVDGSRTTFALIPGEDTDVAMKRPSVNEFRRICCLVRQIRTAQWSTRCFTSAWGMTMRAARCYWRRRHSNRKVGWRLNGIRWDRSRCSRG